MFILMQNQVYSRYVYQMLMLYGRVAIPSLGTFTLHPLAATFGNNRTTLSPPATQLSFDAKVIDEVLFVRQLTEAGMKAEDADLLQAQLVSDYEMSLSQNQDFELGGLGAITSHGFIEKSSGIFNRYQGLEDIAISALPTYLKRQNDFIKTPDAPIILAPKKPESLTNYLWPILIGLITLLVIIGWFVTRDGIADRSVVVEEVTKTEILHDTILNDDSLLAEIDSMLEKSVDSQNGLDTPATVIKKSEPPISQPIAENDIASPTPMKECIVIVGAFKKNQNADKLVKRINAKGYKTYTQMHNGLKRVGISYDCLSKNPDMFKSKVQKQFNKDAWHLHDTI